MDKDMKTIAVSALVGAGFIGGYLAGAARAEAEAHADIPTHECQYEDEVPAATTEDAYDWKAGTPICVHVDALIDQVGGHT